MEQEIRHKKYTPGQAFAKICKWCAYQERCQQEVRTKLYEYGLYKDEVENIIVQLIDQNFINEERFAITYAGGKFRQLGWGKEKIKYALKVKQVSDYCIKKALAQISEENYLETLKEIIIKRLKEEKQKDPILKKYKIVSYAMSRGFEKERVLEILNNGE